MDSLFAPNMERGIVMRDNPRPMQRYRHFKGKDYQVLMVAKDSETMQDVVVYQALYGDYQVYVRPLTTFMSLVDRDKYPDAAQTYRFEEIRVDGGRESGQTADGAPADAAGQELRTNTRMETDDRKGIAGAMEAGEGISRSSNVAAESHGTGTDPHPKSEESGQEAEFGLDPGVLQFLDADTYGERLNILASLRHRVTDEMITTMAMVMDIEVGEGSTKERYEQLRNCLMTKEKYECARRN